MRREVRTLRGFTSAFSRLRLVVLVVGNGAPAGAFEILKLPRVERPDERDKSHGAERQRAGNQPGKSSHLRPPTEESRSLAALSLSALSVTATDDSDMASAAISGVTCPAIAIGTDTAL